MGTIIVGAIVGVVFFGVLFKLIRDKKNGKGGSCGCGSGDCGGCCGCAFSQPTDTETKK